MLSSDGSRGTLLIWVIAALLGGIALLRVAGCGEDAGRGSAVRVARAPEQGPGSSQRADGGGGAGIYVHVAGAVRRPGLLRLPDGARVAAAVDRAGGPLRKADLAGVNLAAKLEDGRQIVVPRKGAGATGVAAAAGGAPAEGAAGGGTSGGPVNLNTATVEQLDTLDGVGPTTAQKIIDYREQHGGFGSVNELDRIPGIGEKRMAALRDQVTV